MRITSTMLSKSKNKWLKLSRGFCNKSNWGYEQKNIIWVLPDNWIQWWRYQSSKFNKTNPTGVAHFFVLMASYGYPANYWRESDNILAIHSPAVGKIFFPRMSDPNNLNKMTAPIPSQRNTVKSVKHWGFWAFFDVQMSKKCTPTNYLTTYLPT